MSTPGDLQFKLADPLLRDIDLPLSEYFFPIGFGLRISTNSQDVLDAAAEAWGTFRPEFDGPPLELRVVVRPQGELAPEASFRSQEHLFSIVSDADNFAFGDSRSMFGYCFVSERTAGDHAWFRWYFLEALTYTLLAQHHIVPVHAACVARNGEGVLLCGVSGAGKSTLAFACARAGWTYIGDDATMLLPDDEDRTGLGKPHQVRLCFDAPRLFPEVADYATCARPNGKLAMEVPMADFPHIRTASRCRIGSVILLERRSGATASVQAVRPSEITHYLTCDRGSYGAVVDAMHERAIRRLDQVPAYRMCYDRLDEAVDLLSRLVG